MKWKIILGILAITGGIVALFLASGRVVNKEITFSSDGAWSWFEDPRAILHGDKLIIGMVADGRDDLQRRGDIEAIVYELSTGKKTSIELHDRLEGDDHNSPAFLALSDGRILTVYAKHGSENQFYIRTSEPNDPKQWGPIRTFVPSQESKITYSNIYQLTKESGRIYNFFRGLDNEGKPSYAFSNDSGYTWATGNIFIRSPSMRPYVRYASNNIDTIHIFYTEGHPRNFGNSVYHIFYKDGWLHKSDGTPIRSLTEGLFHPNEGTRIFKGDPDHVAWVTDIELNESGYPYVAYSVRIRNDHRYRYARWNGNKWDDNEMAYAGTRLYAGEGDYTGLVALDPGNPDIVYISTNSDPKAGTPLISAADKKRHFEIFKGVTRDFGKRWKWVPLTRNSAFDNIRPVMIKQKETSVLLWLRGTYRTFTDYDLSIVGLVLGK